MPVSLTVTTDALTNDEAGAVCAFLLALHPECLADAAQRLNQPDLFTVTRADAEALARGTPEQKPVEVDDRRSVDFTPEPVTIEEVVSAFGGAGPLDAAAAFGATPASPAPDGTQDAPSPNSSNGPTAQPTASPSNAQLDSTGLPHDPRIHSEPPTLTKDGAGPWRKRRGLSQLTENQVIAELRATYPAPQSAAQRTASEAMAAGLVSPPEAGAPIPPAPPPASAAAPPPPPSAPTPAASTGPAPSPSPAPTPPVADPDDATPPATQFAAAMQLATAAQTAGQITMADTQAIITDLGLTSMRDLLAPANHHLIAAFRASVQALIDTAVAA